MKLSHRILNPVRGAALLALVNVAVAFTPVVASATEQVPFKAEYDTQARSTINFPIASVEVVGSGKATQLGASTAETSNQLVNLITGHGTATYYFTAANGDQIVAEFLFTALPTPTGFALDGTWEITGGTGRFTGASGSGVTIGEVIFTGPETAVGHFTMDGTISSPGISK